MVVVLLLLSHFSRVRLCETHRRQPTRLPHPWDSPGKNTGVGCHFLLQRMKVKSEREVAQSCPTLRDPMDCSLPGSSVHGIFQARVLEWGVIAFAWWCWALLNLLVWKAFISPSNLNESFAGWNIFGYIDRFSPFIILNMSCHSLLACRVSVEKSDDNLMGVPLYVICCFSLVVFNILSLSLFSSVWLLCVLVCSSLGSSYLGLCVLPGLGWLFSFPC